MMKWPQVGNPNGENPVEALLGAFFGNIATRSQTYGWSIRELFARSISVLV
jgi:hypothetical protein